MLNFIPNGLAYVGNKLWDPMNPNRHIVVVAKYLTIAQVVHVVALILFTATPAFPIILYALNACSLALLAKTRRPIFAIFPVFLGFSAMSSMFNYNFSLMPIIEF